MTREPQMIACQGGCHRTVNVADLDDWQRCALCRATKKARKNARFTGRGNRKGKRGRY